MNNWSCFICYHFIVASSFLVLPAWIPGLCGDGRCWRSRLRPPRDVRNTVWLPNPTGRKGKTTLLLIFNTLLNLLSQKKYNWQDDFFSCRVNFNSLAPFVFHWAGIRRELSRENIKNPWLQHDPWKMSYFLNIFSYLLHWTLIWCKGTVSRYVGDCTVPLKVKGILKVFWCLFARQK